MSTSCPNNYHHYWDGTVLLYRHPLAATIFYCFYNCLITALLFYCRIVLPLFCRFVAMLSLPLFCLYCPWCLVSVILPLAWLYYLVQFLWPPNCLWAMALENDTYISRSCPLLLGEQALIAPPPFTFSTVT